MKEEASLHALCAHDSGRRPPAMRSALGMRGLAPGPADVVEALQKAAGGKGLRPMRREPDAMKAGIGRDWPGDFDARRAPAPRSRADIFRLPVENELSPGVRVLQDGG
jgi:hypothetical protein